MALLHRLTVLCLLSRRRRARVGLQLGSRLAHSHTPRQKLSAADLGIGVVVLFTAMLTPMAWVLSNLDDFRRH